jgi:hypothetical protein
MKVRTPLLMLALLGLVQVPGSPATASTPGLPSVTSGHRPGPEALYLPAADAPQLQNVAPWEAEPILVSGAVAYADGEFLYQDFLYDDHGAAGSVDPAAPIGSRAHLFSPTAGTFTYPTTSTYANNAADLVEFRVKPLDSETAFRVTLNSLIDANLVAFTIALGGTTGELLPANVAWPHGAGVSSPAERFLTVHGSSASMIDAVTGASLSPAPSVSVDHARRQFDVRIAHDSWDPGTSTVRMTIGVGLWNGSSYLAPGTGSATATTPGGASPTRVAIVNVGPRLSEPYPDLGTPPTYTLGDAAAGAAAQARWWRERAQADALRLGDVSGFAAQVDFAKLSAEIDDDSGVPKSGPVNRILASRYEFGQGLDPTKVCYAIGGANLGAACVGRLQGALQPYALYIPAGAPPAEGWGMTLLLHSLSANQNQYSASRNQAQLGARGGGNLVVTPSGRGPDGFYAGIAEADTFETWADVARHYPVNADRAIVSGYSMGGYGTYRLLARWPDLFSAGFSVVGIPGSADPMIASMRNTPIITWNAVADELVNIQSTESALSRLTAAGLRVTSWLFPTADHLTLATNDEYQQGVDMLEVTDVDRNPSHVTFVVNPGQDQAAGHVIADHAYWVSEVTRRATSSSTGTIDVRSDGFGVGDPTPLPVATNAGALLGGHHGPMPFVERAGAWGAAPVAPVADTLHVTARNIASATIDPVRAGVTCGATLDVTTDGPFTLTLSGCGSYSF